MEPIATARLELRSFRPGDEGDLVAAANDARVSAYLQDRFPSPYTQDDADAWIAFAQTARPFETVALTLADRVIGGIGVVYGSDVYRHAGELGYWLGVDHWGQGYATEAVTAFCGAVFESTELERIFAKVFQGNDASGRVLLKAGFAHEGTARRAVVKNGRYLDCDIYARLRG